MANTRHRLLHSLRRQTFRTGTEIGEALGLSRAAVHKHIQALVDRGVPIHRVPGRGYRLAEGVTLLDEEAIESRLSQPARARLSGLEVLDEVDSTSARLASGTASVDGRVCLAEMQTAGRGRRGRSWIASPYRDLMMSIGIQYRQWPAQLPTLGLVTALMVAEALREQGARDLRVKWPNDVTHEDRKLCGILLDVTGEAHGTCRIIVGVGINVSMDEEEGRRIDRRWTDLESVAGRVPDRNTLAAECLNRLLPAFASFPVEGFAPYRTAWDERDALRGRAITVHVADGDTFHGEAAGVDPSGRLLVNDDAGGPHAFSQGEVSVRLP